MTDSKNIPPMVTARGPCPYWTSPWPSPPSWGRYASSIWLAVQNLFQAARALGLGTRLTTTHIHREQEIKDILDIPDHVETVALVPLGYPRGRFGTTDRKPAAEVSSYNRWGSGG